MGGSRGRQVQADNVSAVKYHRLLQFADILLQLLQYGLLGKKGIEKLFLGAKELAYGSMEERMLASVDGRDVSLLIF